ncbi:hypothetical protein L211DRAFT_875471 [Terfezia boudieri ATCC MYA-4762]|uniref:Uncharacterized protein n=1 Tax=Terfezia boudieri ATCC MYA-4762 TaxID=1051890 RepID=A0A3N4M672_9PEZI|nr:hypothetical protein L211DRAFT_875471 [Terfezia boudieri ATCC MYA-4762]
MVEDQPFILLNLKVFQEIERYEGLIVMMPGMTSDIATNMLNFLKARMTSDPQHQRRWGNQVRRPEKISRQSIWRWPVRDCRLSSLSFPTYGNAPTAMPVPLQ